MNEKKNTRPTLFVSDTSRRTCTHSSSVPRTIQSTFYVFNSLALATAAQYTQSCNILNFGELSSRTSQSLEYAINFAGWPVDLNRIQIFEESNARNFSHWLSHIRFPWECGHRCCLCCTQNECGYLKCISLLSDYSIWDSRSDSDNGTTDRSYKFTSSCHVCRRES